MSSRCPRKMTFRFVKETCFRHLQNVKTGCLVFLKKASSRHLAEVFLLTGL